VKHILAEAGRKAVRRSGAGARAVGIEEPRAVASDPRLARQRGASAISGGTTTRLLRRARALTGLAVAGAQSHDASRSSPGARGRARRRERGGARKSRPGTAFCAPARPPPSISGGTTTRDSLRSPGSVLAVGRPIAKAPEAQGSPHRRRALRDGCFSACPVVAGVAWARVASGSRATRQGGTRTSDARLPPQAAPGGPTLNVSPRHEAGLEFAGVWWFSTRRRLRRGWTDR
jgi:hypothetical protein